MMRSLIFVVSTFSLFFAMASKEEEEQPSKRAKTGIVLTDYISKELLEKEGELKTQYRESKPYRHCLLENLFEPDFLNKVRSEIKENSKVNFKESDLFRVYQSIDLANLTEDTGKDLPTVLKLREILYSDDWRSFIERIAQLPEGTLNSQVDCACNCHSTGCHLLCHDDVIGTRKISYILYLTENDWTREEGGALELYDSTQSEDGSARIPNLIPSKTVLPTFNSMAFFTVEPGYSFHAVQEVLGDRPRLSLQGWYHAAEPPENMEAATLQRLKAMGEEDTEGNFAVCSYPASLEPPSDHLSVSDRKYLAEYLHETYLTTEAIKEIRERFEEESSVQLRGLLLEKWAEKVRKATVAEDEKVTTVLDANYYEQGASDSWKLIGPSHKQRFLEYTGSTSDDPQSAGEVMQHLRSKVLESAPFWRFLGLITSLGLPTGHKGHIRRFRRGLDYTVAHYGLLTTKSVLDATLCFVAGKGTEVPADESGDNIDEADYAWQSGDVGGFECYIAADDDEEAADEYNQDDDTELLSVSASNNTLSLVYRDPGTMRFVKYLGSKAPSSRWDISMEYEVEEEDEDEEEGGEGKGADEADGEGKVADGEDEGEERRNLGP